VAAGTPPFSGATPIEIASQHVSKAPVPPRQLGADVSEGMQALILDCLAKHPDDRPTAEGVRSRLEAEFPTAPVQPPAPVIPPTRAEQTITEPASPPPGAEGGGAVRREGRRAGLLLVLAVLAVLAVVGALAAPNLFGGNGEPGSSGENNAQLGGNEGRSGGQPGGGTDNDQGSQGSGGDASPSAAASASAGPSASPQGSSSPVASGNVPERGVFTAPAAEDTVRAFYATTSEGDYERSARLLTDDWRQEWFPNEETFEGTFDKVEGVVFIVGPSAEISGNTAEVTGETRATLKEEVQHNKGTWYLVREDGRWKIDGWDVVELSDRPA
jgi:ketosteroid isomerase-like protein